MKKLNMTVDQRNVLDSAYVEKVETSSKPSKLQPSKMKSLITSYVGDVALGPWPRGHGYFCFWRPLHPVNGYKVFFMLKKLRC
jgi:hypothetical protein